MVDLSKLTEFNPAIIYCFDAEASVDQASGSTNYDDTILHSIKQYVDIYQAYIYAQNEVLPQLRNNLSTITSQQFIGYIKRIHQLIGNTVLGNANNRAGVFSTQSIFRWEYRLEFASNLFRYLIGNHECKDNKSMARYLAKTLSARENEVLDFLLLLENIDAMPNVQFHPSQMPEVKKYLGTNQQNICKLYKLQAAYNGNLLSTKQKEQVRKIVKICMFHSDIPAAMERYAEQTLKELAQCSKTNVDEIAAFLAKSFYTLADIHPFDNANGRLATCMMNLYLRVLNQPSILLRAPGEKEDTTSDYYKAFEQVDETQKPLQKLIYNKIIQAQRVAFSDEAFKTQLLLKFQLDDMVQKIRIKEPNFEVGSLENNIDIMTRMKARMLPRREGVTLILNELIKLVSEKEKSMNKSAAISYSLTSLSKEQKQQLKAGLLQISGVSGWEIYTKTGLVALCQFNNEAEARAMVTLLNKDKLVNASLKKLTENNAIWVVKCEEIKFQQIIGRGVEPANSTASTVKNNN